MSAKKTAPYFGTQRFIDDCKELFSLSEEKGEPKRIAICLAWSENLVEMGGFPSHDQTEALAAFAVGEISIAIMLGRLGESVRFVSNIRTMSA